MGRVTPEGRVLRACLDYLKLNGIFAFRNNTGGVPLHDGSGRYRPAPKSSKGSADIIAVTEVECHCEYLGCKNAIPIAIEVKSATGRQSPAQVSFARAWEAAGGIYIIARSTQELGAKLREAGVETRTR